MKVLVTALDRTVHSVRSWWATPYGKHWPWLCLEGLFIYCKNYGLRLLFGNIRPPNWIFMAKNGFHRIRIVKFPFIAKKMKISQITSYLVIFNNIWWKWVKIDLVTMAEAISLLFKQNISKVSPSHFRGCF